MRKRYQRKRRTCRLCKPHKRGLAPRWRPQEAARLAAAGRAIRAAGPATAGDD
jgi:hypothetical protein